MNCPSCGSSHTHTIRSRVCTNGTRRRRRECRDCDHRWSDWDGPLPQYRGGSTAKRGRRITPDEVEQMLVTRRLNHSEMGRRLELHKATVRNVRLGNILAHVRPDVPRWAMNSTQQTRSCHACVHWSAGACGFGFPDAIEEGPAFASECELYQAA